jgi:hypothetical protein
MHLRGGTPFPHDLDESLVGIHLGRGGECAGELLKERAAILDGQELRPRKRVLHRSLKRRWCARRKAAKGYSQRTEHIGSLCVTLGEAEQQIWLVPAAQQYIASVEVGRHIIGVAEKIRERTLNDSHATIISELIQICRGHRPTTLTSTLGRPEAAFRP